MSDRDNVVVVNLRADMSEVLGTVEEFQQWLRWRQTHSLLPARLPCDCGTPTVLRAADGHIQCERCGHEERRRQHAAIGNSAPYEMHRIIQRAFETLDGGFISSGDIHRAFQADTKRRYDEGRTRYDDYRATHPHTPKAECEPELVQPTKIVGEEKGFVVLEKDGPPIDVRTFADK